MSISHVCCWRESFAYIIAEMQMQWTVVFVGLVVGINKYNACARAIVRIMRGVGQALVHFTQSGNTRHHPPTSTFRELPSGSRIYTQRHKIVPELEALRLRLRCHHQWRWFYYLFSALVCVRRAKVNANKSNHRNRFRMRVVCVRLNAFECVRIRCTYVPAVRD